MRKTLARSSCFLHFPHVLKCLSCFISVIHGSGFSRFLTDRRAYIVGNSFLGVMWIGHPKKIRKLRFPALAFRSDEGLTLETSALSELSNLFTVSNSKNQINQIKPRSHMPPTYLGTAWGNCGIHSRIHCGICERLSPTHNLSQALTTGLPAKLSWVQRWSMPGANYVSAINVHRCFVPGRRHMRIRLYIETCGPFLK